MLRPIGIVRSELRELPLAFQNGDLELRPDAFAEADSERVSELIFDAEFTECLDGIEAFSHIVVLYWAHQISEHGRNTHRVHPGGRKDYPLVGVFATRSPARPNPICTTTVELLERDGNLLRVRGLDAVDGSPLIDVKPHLPSFDAPSNVNLPDWMKALSSYFSSLRQKRSNRKE